MAAKKRGSRSKRQQAQAAGTTTAATLGRKFKEGAAASSPAHSNMQALGVKTAERSLAATNPVVLASLFNSGSQNNTPDTTPSQRTASKMPASTGSLPAGRQHQPYVAGGSTQRAQAKVASSHEAMSSLSGSFAQFGIDPEQDNFDALDLMAQHIIDLLTTNVYTFANLTRYERNLLYRYFYKTNPVIGRLIDLHTDLPLSKTRLQAPPGLPEIAKDYIMQFYERLLPRLNFPEFLRDLVLTHWLYGEATAFVDDYFLDQPTVLQDITYMEDKVYSHNEEDQKQLTEIEKRYDQEPKSVSISERHDYISLKFKNFFNRKYTGPDKLRVLKFHTITEYMENEDIGYNAVRYQLSDSFTRLRENRTSDQMLLRMGYSTGFLEVVNDPEYCDGKTLVLDNDTYAGVPYIFSLRRPEGSSLILRIMNEALEWEASKRAMRHKIETIGQIGRIVTGSDLSDEQTNFLRSEVMQMMEDPNYAIVSNFDIKWQEVNNQIKEELQQLIDAQERITEVLALGGGMPVSLLSGDSAYSGSSIKLEILNVEYHSFKQRLQSLIEEQLFKPTALRKGFVSIDDWGNPTVMYPRLTFSRVSIRDESVYDILFGLYQKGSVPVSILLDILNLDPADVKRGIENDLFTVNDSQFNEVIRGVYATMADEIYQTTNVTETVIANLSLKSRTPPNIPDALENTPVSSTVPPQ